MYRVGTGSATRAAFNNTIQTANQMANSADFILDISLGMKRYTLQHQERPWVVRMITRWLFNLFNRLEVTLYILPIHFVKHPTLSSRPLTHTILEELFWRYCHETLHLATWSQSQGFLMLWGSGFLTKKWIFTDVLQNERVRLPNPSSVLVLASVTNVQMELCWIAAARSASQFWHGGPGTSRLLPT